MTGISDCIWHFSKRKAAALRACLVLALLWAGHAPAFAQKGFYRISGWQSGIKVFLDDEQLRDAAGQHAPGIYTLRVEQAGFHTYVDKVTISSDQLVEIRIHDMSSSVRSRPFRQRRDARMVPMTGTLIVTSDPPGQEVYLDSLLQGETPLVLENVLVGQHNLQIGKAAEKFSLQIFETVRLRMQGGKILNVTDEDLPAEQKGVAIEGTALFMAETEDEALNCAGFSNQTGGQVFRLKKEGSFLICRMSFRLPNPGAIHFPARFRLFRGNDLISDIEHNMIIDQGENRVLCYYHHEWWRPGEYILTIDGAAGHRLAQQNFTIYF